MAEQFPSPIAIPGDIADALARVRTRIDNGTLPRLLYIASLSSTNDVADRLAGSGALDGTTVVAEQQTAGRGRLGRTWFSPPGAGLYASVIVRVDAAFPVPLVSLTAGLAFAEGARAATHLPVDIKWPNDLVIGRRKLAGILTEASGSSAFAYVVVGVGINLHPAAYPPEIADRATCIETELGRPVDRGLVLAECLASFSEWITRLRGGQSAEMLDRWRRLSPSSHGARVEYTSQGSPTAGTTVGIDVDGALLVESRNGVERIVAGEVRWF